MLEISVVKANTGIYVSGIESMLVNGIVPVDTFHKAWKFIPDITEIETIESICRYPKQINQRYEIIDASLVGDTIPAVIPAEDVAIDDDYSWTNYASMQSLYKLKGDAGPNISTPVEFVIKSIKTVNIDNIDNPCDMKVSVTNNAGSFSEKIVELNLSEIVTYSDLVRMLTPEILLHTQPVTLPSPQLYKIIRSCVEEHIDPKKARITSNYDFCFTVEKYMYHEPVQKEVYNSRGISYRKKRYVTVRSAPSKVFEMTDTNARYKDYTPIEAISAPDLETLCADLDKYLDDLIEYINSDITICEKCNGHGYLFDDKFDIQIKRKR